MYRKIAVSERMPEDGKEVITIDSEGNAIQYKRFGDSWNMPNLPNNNPIEYWLEWVEDGSLREAFKVFIDKVDSEKRHTLVMSTTSSGEGALLHVQGNADLLTQMVTQLMLYSSELAEIIIEAADDYSDKNNS